MPSDSAPGVSRTKSTTAASSRALFSLDGVARAPATAARSPAARAGGRRPAASPAARRAARASRRRRAASVAAQSPSAPHAAASRPASRSPPPASAAAITIALPSLPSRPPSSPPLVAARRRPCAPRSPPATKPLACGGAMITWILSDSLSASVFWISSGFFWISAASRAICSADALPVTSMRYASASASLRARVGLAAGLDAPRLRLRLGLLQPRHLRRLGLEPALLDLLLLERQHVLHRLFLRLGGDDLLLRRPPRRPSRA